jgi:hypothetical protein
MSLGINFMEDESCIPRKVRRIEEFGNESSTEQSVSKNSEEPASSLSDQQSNIQDKDVNLPSKADHANQHENPSLPNENFVEQLACGIKI